uniref:Uncharacterized protein n=1 Tax=Romanomermis culicivorax TaxID=13658 RepID=A0A915IU92_ROMCU
MLKKKLDALNRIMDDEIITIQEQMRRAQLIHSGISEDSDYTSDISFPVHHPNSSIHQFGSQLHPYYNAQKVPPPHFYDDEAQASSASVLPSAAPSHVDQRDHQDGEFYDHEEEYDEEEYFRSGGADSSGHHQNFGHLQRTESDADERRRSFKTRQQK